MNVAASMTPLKERRGRRTRSRSTPLRGSVRFKTTIRWRREQRMRILQRLVAQTAGIRWSAALIELVLDELIVGDELRDLIGDATRLPVRRYPQAVAVALALRHSYREDILRALLRRLRQASRASGAEPKGRLAGRT